MSTAAPKTLDIRPLPAGRRLPTVRAVFKDLDTGDSFVLVDDRNPAPMRARIEEEWPREARWTSLEEGPPVWSVRVQRRGG